MVVVVSVAAVVVSIHYKIMNTNEIATQLVVDYGCRLGLPESKVRNSSAAE